MSDIPFTHASAQLASGVRLHHVTAGDGPDTLVLLHGYPQTWYEFRHVIGPLAAAGFRVIAPDYRGAGLSSKPGEGYDKRTMAADIRELLRDHLGVDAPITLLGHDIGMMVAYAYASSYPDDVARLVLMEAPLPGTKAYDTLVAQPRLARMAMWHFFFHNADDGLAETLTTGREKVYLQSFYLRLAYDAAAIGDADLEHYATAYAAAGAMRAGFELYRAFDRDGDANRAALLCTGKLKMPVLAVGGAESFFAPIAKEMLAEVAKNVTVKAIPRCGHWIAEEQPAAFVEAVLGFAKG